MAQGYRAEHRELLGAASGMQEVVETLHAQTRWSHPWEGEEGAGVELAIPKGFGATHFQGQVFNFRLLVEDLPRPRTDVRPPRDGNTAGSRRRTKRWEDTKKRQDRLILTSR